MARLDNTPGPMTPYRRKLALAILIWTLGALPLIAAAVQTALVVLAPVDDFAAPGSIRVRLHEGDEKAILLHARGSGLGRFDDEDVSPSELDCVARSADGERVVRARRIDGYAITHDEDVYLSKVGFTAPATGPYVVSCDLHGTAVEHAPLGLSRQAHLARTFGEGFAALALCAGTIMGGVVLMRRARREREPPTRP
jgi:hypothetical protein